MENTISVHKKDPGYAAFFDLDRTISGAISGRALAKAAVKKGLMNKTDLLNALYLGLSYRLGVADPARIMEKMTRWVKDIPVNELTELCSYINREVMIPAIHRDIYKELEFHRASNGRTVILSSTLIPVCREIAEYLEMDDIICSELEVKNNLLTGRAVGKLCYGDEKVRRLQEYCEKINSTASQAWYYADALIDFPALSIVGNPVCVNPDRKLRKKALEKGWKIFTWK